MRIVAERGRQFVERVERAGRRGDQCRNRVLHKRRGRETRVVVAGRRRRRRRVAGEGRRGEQRRDEIRERLELRIAAGVEREKAIRRRRDLVNQRKQSGQDVIGIPLRRLNIAGVVIVGTRRLE
ncbi:MAG: hypothetical protein IOD08_00500 [Bradyrhizobium sp.]|uniref:hypothetical protein n=1 Tax=Bradyrhizobium sp. TaxID=376 RepID=UPI0025C03EF7|nr:hypothetical protein [Bradyrhizobium sp.]MCA3575747.1 hypothetical protein [Bradyrhizobium sp.]